jgi:hypothetical protein
VRFVGLLRHPPCNTSGSLIGEGYFRGLNLTLEAVRQLRGDAANQLTEVCTALVSTSPDRSDSHSRTAWR